MTGNCEYGGAILRGEEPKIFYYWFPGMLPVSGLPFKGVDWRVHKRELWCASKRDFG